MTGLPTGLIKGLAVLIGLALVLCGCMKPWEPDLDPSIIACRGYGFYEGTPEFDKCMKYVTARKRTP